MKAGSFNPTSILVISLSLTDVIFISGKKELYDIPNFFVPVNSKTEEIEFIRILVLYLKSHRSISAFPITAATSSGEADVLKKPFRLTENIYTPLSSIIITPEIFFVNY